MSSKYVEQLLKEKAAKRDEIAVFTELYNTTEGNGLNYLDIIDEIEAEIADIDAAITWAQERQEAA